MNLDELPDEASVLIDANILLYGARKMSPQCARLLVRCAKLEIRGFVSALTLAEFCHRRMMQEAQSLALAGSNPARQLSRKPEVLSSLHHYRADVRDMLGGDLAIVELCADDVSRALEIQEKHRLMTNDSLFVAAACRLGIPAIASADPQFDSVPGLTRYAPTDLVMV